MVLCFIFIFPGQSFLPTIYTSTRRFLAKLFGSRGCDFFQILARLQFARAEHPGSANSPRRLLRGSPKASDSTPEPGESWAVNFEPGLQGFLSLSRINQEISKVFGLNIIFVHIEKDHKSLHGLRCEPNFFLDRYQLSRAAGTSILSSYGW